MIVSRDVDNVVMVSPYPKSRPETVSLWGEPAELLLGEARRGSVPSRPQLQGCSTQLSVARRTQRNAHRQQFRDERHLEKKDLLNTSNSIIESSVSRTATGTELGLKR